MAVFMLVLCRRQVGTEDQDQDQDQDQEHSTCSFVRSFVPMYVCTHVSRSRGAQYQPRRGEEKRGEAAVFSRTTGWPWFLMACWVSEVRGSGFRTRHTALVWRGDVSCRVTHTRGMSEMGCWDGHAGCGWDGHVSRGIFVSDAAELFGQCDGGTWRDPLAWALLPVPSGLQTDTTKGSLLIRAELGTLDGEHGWDYMHRPPPSLDQIRSDQIRSGQIAICGGQSGWPGLELPAPHNGSGVRGGDWQTSIIRTGDGTDGRVSGCDVM